MKNVYYLSPPITSSSHCLAALTVVCRRPRVSYLSHGCVSGVALHLMMMMRSSGAFRNQTICRDCPSRPLHGTCKSLHHHEGGRRAKLLYLLTSPHALYTTTSLEPV